jgi:hypothetical protein
MLQVFDQRFWHVQSWLHAGVKPFSSMKASHSLVPFVISILLVVNQFLDQELQPNLNAYYS